MKFVLITIGALVAMCVFAKVLADLITMIEAYFKFKELEFITRGEHEIKAVLKAFKR